MSSQHPARIDLFTLDDRIAFIKTDFIRFRCHVRVKGAHFHLNTNGIHSRVTFVRSVRHAKILPETIVDLRVNSSSDVHSDRKIRDSEHFGCRCHCSDQVASGDFQSHRILNRRRDATAVVPLFITVHGFGCRFVAVCQRAMMIVDRIVISD